MLLAAAASFHSEPFCTAASVHCTTKGAAVESILISTARQAYPDDFAASACKHNQRLIRANTSTLLYFLHVIKKVIACHLVPEKMTECALLFDRYGVDVEGSFPIIGKGKGGKARINNSVPGLKHISTGKLPFFQHTFSLFFGLDIFKGSI